MALVVPNVGEAEMLKRIVGDATTDVHLHLFVDNITPDEATVIGDFTEVFSQNYALKPLAGTWTVGTLGDPTPITYPQETWTFDGTGDGLAFSAYGYFVTADDDTTLLWTERFTDAPYNIPDTGGSISITPRLELE